MNKRSKIITSIVVGGLTCTTLSACYWQTNRYFQADSRWKKMGKQFNEGLLFDLELSNLPEFKNQNEIYDWEYMLVKVKGKLQKQNVFIWRFHEGQYGYQILNSIKNEKGEGLMINLGWVLSKKRSQFAEIDEKIANQEVQLVSMVKKAELEDYLTQQKTSLQTLDEHSSYIDLNDLGSKFGLTNLDNCNKVFLEHFYQYQEDNKQEPNFKQTDIIFKKENNEKQDENVIDDYEQSNLPIVPNINTYAQPFLTPGKHIEYASFWGVCSVVGITSLVKILKM